MAKQDLALNAAGDLYLNEKGDFEVIDSVRQAAQIKLRWLRNEWVFNPAIGVPYFEQIFSKRPNLAVVEKIIKEHVLSVEGVQSVTACNLNVDTKNRVLHGIITVQSIEGELECEVNLNGNGLWNNR